jgi:16S rRNA (guanine527-N7)-methyltransferase
VPGLRDKESKEDSHLSKEIFDFSDLKRHAAGYNIEVSERHIELLDAYLKELIEWNSRMNLTGLADRGRMVSELFLDSLMPVPHLPPKGRMLDAGSGAGFPALVIKVLLPGLNMSLIESNSKKASFLKQIIRLLKLDHVEVINGRLETEGDRLRLDGFDIISARALADLNRIITWCAHLLSQKGLLVYFSGSRVDEVLENSKDLMKAQCLVPSHTIPYSLPGIKDGRNIIILKKDD